jgi:hypothetical protein
VLTTLDQKRLVRTWHNIRARCRNPSVHRYSYYGGRGIKCLIKYSDLMDLWQRDHASEMSQPSIDRINPDGHYTKENCRFVELVDNRKNRRFKSCPSCESRINWGSPHEYCHACRSHPCSVCGKPFTRCRPRQRRCSECETVTRPCVHCGKAITRTNIVRKTRYARWACCGYQFVSSVKRDS